MKRFASIILCIVMLFSLATSACAVDHSYTDVRGNEWYAEAVAALREKGIMDGVGDNRFDPDGVFTRAQLATVLYRLADKPAVSGENSFADTQNGQWYSDAVLWASQNGIVHDTGQARTRCRYRNSRSDHRNAPTRQSRTGHRTGSLRPDDGYRRRESGQMSNLQCPICAW